MEKIKQKIMWWIAFHIPKQAALYAFVRVHSLTGEGPTYDGEYSMAYKKWVDTHKLKQA